MPQRINNVYPLRPHEMAPGWGSRLLAVGSYMATAALFPRIQHDELINLLMLMGIAYWAFVGQRKHAVPYYVRYHWLQIIVLMLLLGILCAIATEAVQLVVAALPLLGIAAFTSLPAMWALKLTASACMLIKLFVPFGLGLACLVNKSPQLPVVSVQARQWA
jgi:hypothetical protein